jgi:hypothetical protein
MAKNCFVIFIFLLSGFRISAQTASAVTEKECYDFINQWLRENNAINVFCLNYKLDCTERLFSGGQIRDLRLFLTPADILFMQSQIKEPLIKSWDRTRIQFKATVSDRELKQLFKSNNPDDWRKFEKRFHCHKYDDCSQPFFNSDRTLCLIYVTHSCGGLCSSGDWLLMEYKAGKWVKKVSCRCWIS